MLSTSPVEAAMEALLDERGVFTSRELSRRSGRTRQALHRHLSRWVAEGRLVREGRGRATRYRRAVSAVFDRSYRTAGLSESDVWEELRAALPELGGPGTENAEAVLRYVVTELVNNAVDHSGAPSVSVRADREGGRVAVVVADAGIGAFEDVRRKFCLDDALHALQELSKGKVTARPERHTGEGLFFSSKMVGRFELAANGLEWEVDNERADQAVSEVPDAPGTAVRVELPLDTATRVRDVFARYTHDFEFDTSRCVVRLFEHGTSFVSRSEAKRLAAGLDKFREVIVDFQGVQGVGQGFVDELFRVWAREHPDVRLVPENMNRAVEFMVRRGLPKRGGHQPGPA